MLRESVSRFDLLDREFAEIRRDVAETKADVKSLGRRVAKLESDVNLLKWVVGFNLAFTLGILWKLLT